MLFLVVYNTACISPKCFCKHEYSSYINSSCTLSKISTKHKRKIYSYIKMHLYQWALCLLVVKGSCG